VVDLNGSTLMPGFFDPHGHLFLTTLSVAYLDLSAPPIGKVDSIAKLQEVLKNYIETRHPKPEEWIIGMNYDDTLLKEKRHPTRKELDAVSTTYPIFLLHISSHLAAVNSKAISKAGLNDTSTDPKGGRFRRDAQGHLSGIVEEGAGMMPFMQKIPHPSAEVARKYLQKTLNEKFVKEGITTVQEAGTLTPPLWELLKNMANALNPHGVKQGVLPFCFWMPMVPIHRSIISLAMSVNRTIHNRSWMHWWQKHCSTGGTFLYTVTVMQQ